MTELEKAKQGIQGLIAQAEQAADKASSEMQKQQAVAFALRNALHEVEKSEVKPEQKRVDAQEVAQDTKQKD